MFKYGLPQGIVTLDIFSDGALFVEFSVLTLVRGTWHYRHAGFFKIDRGRTKFTHCASLLVAPSERLFISYFETKYEMFAFETDLPYATKIFVSLRSAPLGVSRRFILDRARICSTEADYSDLYERVFWSATPCSVRRSLESDGGRGLFTLRDIHCPDLWTVVTTFPAPGRGFGETTGAAVLSQCVFVPDAYDALLARTIDRNAQRVGRRFFRSLNFIYIT